MSASTRNEPIQKYMSLFKIRWYRDTWHCAKRRDQSTIPQTTHSHPVPYYGTKCSAYCSPKHPTLHIQNLYQPSYLNFWRSSTPTFQDIDLYLPIMPHWPTPLKASMRPLFRQRIKGWWYHVQLICCHQVGMILSFLPILSSCETCISWHAEDLRLAMKRMWRLWNTMTFWRDMETLKDPDRKRGHHCGWCISPMLKCFWPRWFTVYIIK